MRNVIKMVLDDISNSWAHKAFLLIMLALFIAVVIWKSSPAPSNTRQATIDRVMAGFTNGN